MYFECLNSFMMNISILIKVICFPLKSRYGEGEGNNGVEIGKLRIDGNVATVSILVKFEDTDQVKLILTVNVPEV